MPLTRSIFSLAVLLASLPAAAQSVNVTVPLEGYTRLGKATAIHLSGEGLPSTKLTVTGDGVIPVTLPATAGRVEATIPLLTHGMPPAAISWSAGQTGADVALAIRPLRTDDRLVAIASDNADVRALAEELFPDKKAILVRLDTNRPRLLWPPQAYDAADAILLDPAAAARVDEAQLRVLLAAGTTVAIRTTSKPAGLWPWRQQGAWWVLRHTPVGPHGGVNVDAYDPTYAWDRSWPISQRKALLLSAIGMSLLLAGATLLRGRGAFIACVVVLACAVTGSAFYTLSLTPAVVANGDVLVWNGALGQRDRWTYVSAFREDRLHVEATDRCRPVLGTRRQIETLGLGLTCDTTGQPDRFEFTLGAKQTIAFVSRSVTPTAPADVHARADVPMDLIADKLYPGKVADQTAAAPAGLHGEWWGEVVMRQ